MTEAERLLLDIATRMPDRKEMDRVILWLDAVNQNTNICNVLLGAIVVVQGLILWRLW